MDELATTYPITTAPAASWSGPLAVPVDDHAGVAAWIRDNRRSIDAALLEHGALLFRRCEVSSPAAFQEIAAALCDSVADYVYRSTPRTTLHANVYTATEYRADATIPLHNENSYQRDWPMKLVFCCVTPAATGGETPLALTSAVTQRIDPAIVEQMQESGVLYVRNYGGNADLTWQTTFQTESRAEVEAFCRKHDIDCTWLDNDTLRTAQRCHAVAFHPVTGERLWFNQAHLFHVSSLGPDDAEAMLEVFGEAHLPRHAYRGDGAPLESGLLEHIRRAYDAETVAFSWQRGDVLLLDNMRVAHGRRPFTGARQVLVAMGDMFSTRR